MAFYILHDTFIAQKHEQSVLKSRTNYGLKNVNNDEKRLNNFEHKLLLKNYKSRQTNELVEINKKKRNNEAKETNPDTTLRNRKETEECENQYFAKKHQLIGDKETSDKKKYLPMATNNQKILSSELKSIEEREEKCEKEIDNLVNDLNNNKMKEETSKDLIKCSAQEDIPDTKHDIKVTESITCTKLTIINMEISNPDQNNNIQLKQETEENFTKNTNKEINEFKTVQSDIEQNVNEYVENMETEYITRKKIENNEREQIHLEQTEIDKTGELKSEYEVKGEIKYEFEGKGEVENEYEEIRKVNTEFGETEYEEETKYEEAECKEKDNGETREETEHEENNQGVKREVAIEYEKRGKVETEFEETEEVETKYKETGEELNENNDTEEVETEFEETEEIQTVYKETGEVEIEYEETEEVETGEVEIEYEETVEEETGYEGTVKKETQGSKTEEVDTNLKTNVADTYSTIDKHNKNRKSEDNLLFKTKQSELISQRNKKQKVIEKEYEIYKALIIPHKTQKVHFEEEFVAKLNGIEENEKKINTENDTKHMKNEITKLEKQDIDGHKSLKLKGTHKVSPSTEEGQLYWIFLAVSWLPVLLLVSLAFSFFQMIEELENC